MRDITGINPFWVVSKEVRAAAEAFLRSALLRPVGDGAGTLAVERDGQYFAVTFDPNGKIIATSSGSVPKLY